MDGHIVSDQPVEQQIDAEEMLARMPSPDEWKEDEEEPAKPVGVAAATAE